MWHTRRCSSIAHDINKYNMIIGLIFLALLIMSLVYGFKNYLGLDVIFEINMFSSPYHQLGVSFFGENNKTHYVETLAIGLVFVNIIIVFYKEKREI